MRLLLAALALAASLAHAGRPFVTDDARIVDPGGCQIETFYKKQREFRESEFGFIPACNPWGRVELSLGGTWVASDQPGDSRIVALQAKTLLVPLATNGVGFALALGVARVSPFQSRHISNPYLNGIASLSFLDDRVVVHANVGAIRDRQFDLTRGTWGIGAEVLVTPRFYAIVETYGQRLEKPTLHGGVRVWIIPERLQADATVGMQHSSPFDRRFATVGMRLLW
ncbi:MAG: hypothetical protein ACREVG_18090 [Burkholderiales bacterium]